MTVEKKSKHWRRRNKRKWESSKWNAGRQEEEQLEEKWR